MHLLALVAIMVIMTTVPPAHAEKVHPSLRRDIRELSTMLGTVLIQQEGRDLFRQVETIRRMTKAFRLRPTEAAAARIESVVQSLALKDAHRVVRAFSLYFLLANAAEEAHRIRMRLARAEEPKPGLASPLQLALDSLKRRVTGTVALRQFLKNAHIRLVFTAHPTEATRQTVLQKLSAITRLIIEKERVAARSSEGARLHDRLMGHVTLLWQTSELRANKVTVRDEVLRGLYFFSRVLFDSVPRLGEELQRQVRGNGSDTRIAALPVSLGSWMGGDRDGHPFVTPEVTSTTLEQHRQAVLERYAGEIEVLYGILSSSEHISPVSRALRDWTRRELRRVPLPEATSRTEPFETYRWALRVIHWKLLRTRSGNRGGYLRSSDLERDVERIDISLRRSGAAGVANQYVLPLLWAVRSFGFSLASLDIRQNAAAIRVCIDKMLSAQRPRMEFAALPEHTKRSVLLRHLRGRRRFRTSLPELDSASRRIREEFQMIALARRVYEPSALGSYIISNAGQVSDMLSALLLAKDARLIAVRNGSVVSSQIDVVPLFETIDDLRRAPEVLRELFSIPLYRSQLRVRRDRQEIMIGYSDSSKDGGIVSAAFELYRAQIQLDAAARSFGVQAVFFHGRGGSISRGGGPVYESIIAQPRETMNGTIKITEQGEMISAKYLMPETALYSLEVTAAAVLYCTNVPLQKRHRSARARYMQEFQAISDAAGDAYRSMTRHAGFWEFYRAVTPLDIIEKIEIGSRPASRGPRGRLGSLRAIPWVFSWTQCRLAITGWFGFGSAVDASVRQGKISWRRLHTMYDDWPFFRTLVDNIEMVMAKTDLVIGGRYMLLGDRSPEWELLSSSIQREYSRTMTAILRIKREESLLESQEELRQSLALRNPYLDPIHFIQIRFLREFRSSVPGSTRSMHLLDLLRSSVNGIASGMRNTG